MAGASAARRPAPKGAVRALRHALGVFCLCLAWHHHACAGGVRVTVLGGAAQGTMMAMSQAVGEALRREHGGAAYTYEPGSMGGALYRVLRGDGQIAMCGGVELHVARQREAPFDQPGLAEPRVVARISPPLYAYFIATREFVEKNRIHRLADIAQRRIPVRISVGQPGNLTVTRLSGALLDAVGLSEARIRAHNGMLYRLPKRASFDLMKDGRSDVTFTGSYFPDAAITELARAEPVVFIDPGAAVVARVAPQLGATAEAIPQGVYDFVDQAVPSPAIYIYLVASGNTPDSVVRALAQALHRHFDVLRGMHPAFRGLRPETLPQAGRFALHGAAERYYRAVGLIATAPAGEG